MEPTLVLPEMDIRTEHISRMVVSYEKEMLMLCFVYLRNIDLAQIVVAAKANRLRILEQNGKLVEQT